MNSLNGDHNQYNFQTVMGALAALFSRIILYSCN